MQIRPFALLSNAVRDAVRQYFVRELSIWCDDWGIEQQAFTVSCERAWDNIDSGIRVRQWTMASCPNGKTMWSVSSLGFSVAIQKQMFPLDSQFEIQSKRPSSIAVEGASLALKRLIERLRFALVDGAVVVPDNVIPDEGVWQHASGCAIVEIGLHDQTITFLVNHSCVLGVVGPGPQVSLPVLPQETLNLATDSLKVDLVVEIGRAEVDVTSLLTLAVGDVIRLDAASDKPVSVRGPHGDTLFGGHLGCAENMVAVEVCRLN